jgi:hypothetical protein
VQEIKQWVTGNIWKMQANFCENPSVINHMNEFVHSWEQRPNYPLSSHLFLLLTISLWGLNFLLSSEVDRLLKPSHHCVLSTNCSLANWVFYSFDVHIACPGCGDHFMPVLCYLTRSAIALMALRLWRNSIFHS